MNNLHSSKNNSRLSKSSCQNRFVPLVMTGACLLSLGQISPAIAGETRNYKGITQSEFSKCIKNDKTSKGYSIYRGGNKGTAEIRANGGFFGDPWVATLIYSFNPQNRTLDYRLDSKIFAASEGQIWEGINNTISKCQGR